MTHGVQKNSEEELSTIDELVQLIRTARVIFVEDSVREKTTGLSGQHLRHEQKHKVTKPRARKQKGNEVTHSRKKKKKDHEKCIVTNKYTPSALR